LPAPSLGFRLDRPVRGGGLRGLVVGALAGIVPRTTAFAARSGRAMGCFHDTAKNV
jgi:hypothetical protein